MDRRKLLSLTGTAGLASLAGCQLFNSRPEKETPAPPRFTAVELSGPSEVTVGESVSLSVSVTNAGEQAGDFADTLTVETATASDTEIRLDSVPASGTRTVVVGPFAFGRAGEHRFELAHAGASHSVSVSTRTLQGGERFDLPDGSAVAVSEVTPYAALFYDAQNGRDVLAPEDESVLVVFQAELENRGETEIRAGPSSFAVADGEILAEIGGGAAATSLESIVELDGEPLPETSIAPGEDASGWLLAEVPRERVASGVEVTWNREQDESPTNPEAHWTFDPVEAPRFEVSELTVPDDVEVTTPGTVTATVTNAGSVSGTFRGILDRRNEKTDWEQLDTFRRELSPGASATVQTDVGAVAVGRTEYRLRPSSATGTGTVHPAKRALGEQFTTADGAAISAEVGNESFGGVIDYYVYHNDGFHRVQSDYDYTFALVKVTVENVGSETLSFPERTTYSVVVDGKAYSPFHSSTDQNLSLRAPVEGPFYDPSSEYEPGTTYEGWLVFNVPDGVTVEDLTVRCSPADGVVATWSN